MKDYIIWLDSGECIVGSIEDDEAERLLSYYNSSFSSKIKLKDSEGTIFVNLEKVSAIAINEIVKQNQIGY